MNSELIAGLRGALERGFSIESAAQSFINAGYNVSEVQESASFLSKNPSPLPSSTKTDNALPQMNMQNKSSSKTKWIIIILLILLILGLSIGFILFKNQILGAVIDPIFP